jgi:hypothetical protein
MSIRIRFNAHLDTRSHKGEFPRDTIAAVYVTNRDDCTFKEVPVDENGGMAVDFEMKPTKEGVMLTDRIKFHFYFRDNADNLLKPVCAGHMPLEQLADSVNDGSAFEVGSNFNSNRVTMNFVRNAEHSRAMHLDLLGLYQAKAITKSVLSESATHLVTVKTLDAAIQDGLESNTAVMPDNGGHMFRSVLTAHMMENEATLYSLYHVDFDEGHAVPAWLCTYMLLETLHHNAVTIDQVKAMSMKGITDFISSYAQGPMRSASAVPYTSDLTMTDDPQTYQYRRSMLSEVFKRPYSHPYHLLQGQAHGNLMTDDCEGLVLMLRNLTHHLAYMYNTHAEDFKQTDDYVRFNNLKKRYFPKDLFAGMSAPYQNKLIDLALFLGEKIASKAIECKVTLVSANGASMGTDKTEIQAHACACMVCNDPNEPYAVMLEGTACIADDQTPKRLKLGTMYVSLSEIANSLSRSKEFNSFMEGGFNTKIAMHLTHSKGSFYRTAFCQNDSLLGSQIGQQALTFGVDMEYLADDAIKVYMPITGKVFEKDEYKKLTEYVAARRVEIHPPLINHTELREKLKWYPIGPFRGCKELQAGRPFTTCLVHVLADDKNPVEGLLARATAEATAFNADPENTALGVMRAFVSMDGVSKVFHIYSDNTDALVQRLSIQH